MVLIFEKEFASIGGVNLGAAAPAGSALLDPQQRAVTAFLVALGCCQVHVDLDV